MKTIKIERLALENFKCHKNLVLEFQGRNATVYGDNGTGKTSIYDGLLWLLFGRDSRGNGEQTFAVKPLDENGEIRDHKGITGVEAVLLVDGKKVSLRRTLKEVWTGGDKESSYGGNTSQYYIDGAPCKKFAFQEKIQSIVSEELFRLLTDVRYFPEEMPWQRRRQLLFDITTPVEEKQLLKQTPQFALLEDALGDLTIDSLKAKLLHQRRGLTGTGNELPARISECRKTVEDLAALDFAAARQKKESLTQEKEIISQKLLAIRHNTAIEAKRLEVERENTKLEKLKVQSCRALENARRLQELEKRLSESLKEKEDLQKKVNRQVKELESFSTQQQETEVCALCGQKLPKELAQAHWQQAAQQRQKELERTLQALDNNDYNALLQQKQALEQEIKEEKDISPEISQSAQQLEFLQQELAALRENAGAVAFALDKELEHLNKEMEACNATLGKEDTLNYARQRILELEQQEQEAVEALNRLNKLLEMIDSFQRYKAALVEQGVNARFRLARFRLFRQQLDGSLESRCDVVCGGVPYSGLNSAMRINAGIDIINTLSSSFGVQVPLFIDNAESVTALEKTNSQLIRLVVSPRDNSLQVEYQ